VTTMWVTVWRRTRRGRACEGVGRGRSREFSSSNGEPVQGPPPRRGARSLGRVEAQKLGLEDLLATAANEMRYWEFYFDGSLVWRRDVVTQGRSADSWQASGDRSHPDRGRRRRNLTSQHVPGPRCEPVVRLVVQPILSSAARTRFAFEAGQSLTRLRRTSGVTSGTASPCSSRSASTRSASASTLNIASSRVSPYAITPGRLGTLGRFQRPSSSRSTSTVNPWSAIGRVCHSTERPPTEALRTSWCRFLEGTMMRVKPLQRPGSTRHLGSRSTTPTALPMRKTWAARAEGQAQAGSRFQSSGLERRRGRKPGAPPASSRRLHVLGRDVLHVRCEKTTDVLRDPRRRSGDRRRTGPRAPR